MRLGPFAKHKVSKSANNLDISRYEHGKEQRSFLRNVPYVKTDKVQTTIAGKGHMGPTEHPSRQGHGSIRAVPVLGQFVDDLHHGLGLDVVLFGIF